MPRLRITCLIPAYNEAPRIAAVLKVVIGHPAISRTLVIDDGSSDGTAAVAAAAGAEVITTRGNVGKARALVEGLRRVDTGHVLLIDADLLGLSADAIDDLVRPIAEGRAAATLSLRGNTPWLWRAIRLDYITGERLLPLSLFSGRFEEMEALPGFGFEAYLNRLLIAAGLPIAVVPWPDVASPAKARKHGLRRGVLGDIRMLGDIFHTIGLLGAFRQIVGMKALSRPALR